MSVVVGVLPVLWIGACIAALRHGSTPAQRYTGLAIAAIAVALTLYPPQLYVPFGELLGAPDAGRLAGQAAGGFALLTGEMAFTYITAPGVCAPATFRRRQALLAAALAVMTTLFLHDHACAGEIQVPSGQNYGPAVVTYWGAYTLFMTTGLVRIAHTSWGIRQGSSRYMGAKLVAITTGAVLLLAFFWQYGLVAVGHAVGRDWLRPWILRVGGGCIVTGVVALVLGAAPWSYLKNVRAGVQQIRTVVANKRDYDRLRRIWWDLYGVFPGIALSVPSWGQDRTSYRDMTFRANRRRLEVREGLLRLPRDHWEAIATRARRLCHHGDLAAEDLEPLVEAAVARAAISALLRGETPSATDLPTAAAFGTWDAQRLVRMAHLYSRSRIVRDLATFPERSLGDG